MTYRHPLHSIPAVVFSALVAGSILGSACSEDEPAPAEVDASVPTDASKRDRSAQDPDATAGQCIRCSLISGLLTGGGGGPGGPGGPPAMGDPCDPDAGGGGGPGGMGGITFCNETVFNAFLGCVQTKCSTSCALGPGPGQCDAGTPDSAVADANAEDADTTDGGADCNACLAKQCTSELATCADDK